MQATLDQWLPTTVVAPGPGDSEREGGHPLYSETLRFDGTEIVAKVYGTPCYGGKISQSGGRFGVDFKIAEGTRSQSMWFNTKPEAENYRRSESDKRGLTTMRLNVILDTEHLCASDVSKLQIWAVGFNDGDGGMEIPYNDSNAAQSKHTIKVRIGQSRRDGVPVELVVICGLYGGSIRRILEAKGNRRPYWLLSINRQSEVVTFLRHVEQHGIVEAPLARRALEFADGGRTDGKQASEDMVRLHSNEAREIVPICPERLVPEYVAGLFAADGSCALKNGGAFTLTIAQRTCKPLLRAILERILLEDGTNKNVTGGSIDHGILTVCGSTAVAWAKVIRPFVIGPKGQQIDVVLERRTLTEGAPHPRSKEYTPAIKRRLEDDLKARREKLKQLKRG